MKKLIYLIIFFLVPSLMAMETLSAEVVSEIAKHVFDLGDKSGPAVIKSIKNFDKFSRTNKALRNILIPEYERFLLTNLTPENFKQLNQYIFDSLDKKEFPKDVILLINLLLRLNELDINMIDKRGFTMLIQAARMDHRDIVKLLIKAGANVDANGGMGWTALMWASSLGRDHIIKLLIEAKANVSLQNNTGDTALSLAREHFEAIEKLLTKK
ncbi:ankyrin repeat domain-containing protein [Candidatus Dependentiae bacterium]|nr:ankyrin repeat domain-containing protein [Candidatus Dependentiae bacterium]